MSRKLDLLGWYFQVVSTPGIAIAAAVLQLPPGQWAMLFAAAWVVSAYLTAWPYTRRFGGGMADWLWIGTALGLVVTLPVVPFFWCEVLKPGTNFVIVLLGCFALAAVAVGTLRAQGRHFFVERELPELAGEPRRAFEAVLARAGLEPVSFRVVAFPTFNAMVQGFRKCIVIVDQRLIEAFTTEELSAVLLHEAGHIKHGGILPILGAVTAALTGASVLDVLGWSASLGLLDLIAAVLLFLAITSQWLEFRCDRFAAALASPGAFLRSLEKLDEDLPPAAARVAMSLWSVPVGSHPPNKTRAALLQGGGRRTVAAYLAVLLAASLGLVVLPLSARIAEAASGVGLPAVVEWIAWCGPQVYNLWWILFRVALALAARRVGWAPLTELRRGRRLLWATLIAWSTLFVLMWASPSQPAPDWLVPWILGLLVSALLLTILSLLLGAFRLGPVLLSGRVKRAYLEVNAAIEEGKPDEALAIAEKALRRKPKHPWLQMARGQCLLWLGRLDEAAECLAAPVRNRSARPTAVYLLAMTELLRENPALAGELAGSLVKEVPKNALAWLLVGIAAGEAGRHAEAEASLARSCELKDRNAVALARRVVYALERGLTPGTTDAWMEAARTSDPRWPGVLWASARWRLARGEAAQAREDMRAALDELRKRGMLGWIASFERDARRWGIAEAAPP